MLSTISRNPMETRVEMIHPGFAMNRARITSYTWRFDKDNKQDAIQEDRTKHLSGTDGEKV